MERSEIRGLSFSLLDCSRIALRSIRASIASVDLSSKGAANSVPPLPSGEVELRSNSGQGLRSMEGPEPRTRRSAPTSPDGRGETEQAAPAIVARMERKRTPGPLSQVARSAVLRGAYPRARRGLSLQRERPSIFVDLSPIGVGRLRKIDSWRHERHALQCTEKRTTLGFLWLRKRLGVL